MEIRKEIQELFDKATKLKGKQVLHTTFGSDRYYTIRKQRGEFVLDAFRNKWSFQKEGRNTKTGIFKTAKDLNVHIFSNFVEDYATNHFSKKVIHFDNWINFVNGFKLKRLKCLKGKEVTSDMYFYEEINLVVSD